MDSQKVIKKQIAAFMRGGNSHIKFDEAVAEFPMDRINDIFPNGEYSAYGLLEHIRRTQADILEFMISENYKEKSWPDDFWPPSDFKATEEDWNKTIKLFKEDQEKVAKLAENSETDLNKEILWGDGQTMIREFILIGDHTAYDLGEFCIMRQVMGTWGKSHRE